MEDWEKRKEAFFSDAEAQLIVWRRALLADDIVGFLFQPKTCTWFLDTRISGRERMAIRTFGYLELLQSGTGKPLLDPERSWLEVPLDVLKQCEADLGYPLGTDFAILDKEQ